MAKTPHMWVGLLLTLLSVPAAPAGRGVARLLIALGDLPPGPERTVRASSLLVGTPYEKHPLGEGFGTDPGPRFRVDAFDCQTYVETVLALGQATTEPQVRAGLDDIRYTGAPSFAERNHYMMSQWVPSNLAKGYLFPPLPTATTAEKTNTAQSWAARWPKNIVLPPGRIPLGTFSLPLTTLDELEAHAAEIPDGTVMLVVREDRPGFPDRVTHLGFVIQKNGATFFRHASDWFQRVLDEPIPHFVTRNRRYTYRVSGVALLPLRANGDRVAGLSQTIPEALGH